MKKLFFLSMMIMAILAMAGMSFAQTIPNANCETFTGGKPDGFTDDTKAVASENTTATFNHGGSKSIMLTLDTTNGSTDNSARDLLSTDFITGITAGHIYKAAAFVYDNDNGAKLNIQLHYYDAADAELDAGSGAYSTTYSADGAAFQELSLTRVAPANAVKCKIGCRGYFQETANNGAGKIIYVDDFSITDTGSAPTDTTEIGTVIARTASGTLANIGSVYKVRGIVTTVNFGGTAGLKFCMQDSTGAIMVYKSGASAYYTNLGLAVGSDITVTGTVINYGNSPELTPSAETDVVKLGSGTVPAIIEITISDLQNLTVADNARYALINKVVKLKNVYKNTGSLAWPTTYASANMTVSIGSDSATPTGLMRIEKDTGMYLLPEPTWTGGQNVRAVFYQYYVSSDPLTGFQINPTEITDFTSYSGIDNWSRY